MRVLLFANDLVPFGALPTSGGGLRCYQLLKGLEAHGIEVVVSMPGFTYLVEKHRSEIPEEVRANLWQWGTQDDILRRVKPDVVLFASNWDHYNLETSGDVPVVIDLHGSRLVETRIWGNPADPNHKLRVLSQADCLLCAGRRQRAYFNGWLVQAGRVPQDEHFIRYIPISQDPRLPEHVYPGPEDARAPVFVTGGGWFPWQDQSRAIFAACRAVTSRERGSIHLFGTPHETGHTSPEEQAIREVYRRVQELARASDRITARGYIGREPLLEIYRGASVALETMRRNVEREIAFTTRTIEYLWCGLPVVYNDYSEISDHIREYDAGWAVDPDSDEQIARALDEAFDAAVVRRKGENAQRLVRDRFTWDKTITPLLDFVRSPRKAPAVRPAVGGVGAVGVGSPSYLSLRGPWADVTLRPGQRLTQPFVVPDDAVNVIELQCSPPSERGSQWASDLKLELRDGDGRVRAARRFTAAEVKDASILSLPLPRLRRPRGGDRLVLEVTLGAAAEATPASMAEAPGIALWGLQRPVFPILAGAERTGPGASEPLAVSLALRFACEQSQVARLRFKALRAWDLVRSGHGRLLLRAAARRLPRAARGLSSLLTRWSS